jgi:outer membrane receptor protein involved in Fe transport
VKSRLLCAASLAALLLPAGAAFADDAATSVDELVVTGEKARRSLQDTVASVAVVTAQRIDDEAIQTFGDIVNRTANVAETYGAAGFSIRGVSNIGVTGAGSGGLATIYVDGAAIPDHGLNNGPLDMWDVAQVEILRGPQSTLQGRNALAGAVVIRTQEPTWDWAARGRVLLSDADERSIAFAGGGPIVADQLAFRLAVEDRKSDGFIYNTTRQEDENAREATTVRTSLLFAPATTPGLTARATWTHDERSGGYAYTYARTDVPDAWDNRVATGDHPNRSDGTTDILTLAADYELSDRLTLASVTAWSRLDLSTSFDVDGGPRSAEYASQDETDKTFSQEVRLQYQGERLEGLVGAYYANRELDVALTSRREVPTPVSTLIPVLMSPPFNQTRPAATAIAGLYAAALPVVPVNFNGVSVDEIETMAIFADGRFALTPQLSLLGGFRYDREENVQSVNQKASFGGVYPNPAAFGPLAPVIGGLNQVVGMFVGQASAVQPPTSRTFEAFLPKLGLKYDLTEDASASFVVQRGYRSGGATINVARGAIVTYDPEYTWNYELALRSTWLDDALSLNANAYYVDWTDQQVLVNLGTSLYDTQIENAGASHLYGVELEAAYRVSPRFDGYASLGASHTEFDDFSVSPGASTVDLSGSSFAFAPEWTWAVGGNYRWDNGFVANLNASYRSKAFSAAGPDQANYAIDARTLVNGKIGYETAHWSASIYAKNIFDEQYVQQNQAARNQAMFGDPRVIGAILETRW